jgi:spore maturation protein CgeB
VVWIEKGLTLEASTLRALRERWPQVVLLNYSGDDMFNPRNQSRRWRSCLALYDLHVTTNRYNVPELREAGARDVLPVDKAFDPLVHRPMPVSPEVRARVGGEVGFVGWPEAERTASMLHLARRGVPVRIWGPWGRLRSLHPNLRVEGRPLWSDDYASAVSAFRVNLCFLRKVNRDRHTSRSIQIPACGGFMLAERTEEHQALFDEDREAVYFSSDDELLDKVRWYLAHEDERARIAEAGRRRCWAGGYTYERRLEQVLAHLADRDAEPAGAVGPPRAAVA